MAVFGIVVLFVVVYLVVRGHQARQREAVDRETDRADDACRDVVRNTLNATPGGIYEGWEEATRTLMRKGMSFDRAKRLAEEVIRERIGVGPYDYCDILFELEPKLRGSFGQPDRPAGALRGR
jgi:uncharacterized membrane protein